MKTLSLACLGFVFLLGLVRSPAASPPATVIEAIEHVHYGNSASAITTPARVGTLIQNGDYLRTEAKSRAALQLPTESVVRIGANALYNYTIATNTIDLREGDILFCKPKADSVRKLNVTIKTSAVMAGIVGTTGFCSIQNDPKTGNPTYSFGLVEGHSIVQADGQSFNLKAGDELQFTPPAKPFIFSFDVPHFVKTSLLFTGFTGELPNQKYIDQEIARFLDEESRGFIRPANSSLTTNYAGIPSLPTTAFDSAQNAQGNQGAPPPPKPPR